jgi:NitT/TauT family transport system permease protein
MVDAAEQAWTETHSRMPRWVRSTLWFVAISGALIACWELYKVVGTGLGIVRPVRPDNVTMPHVWDMIAELFQPARRGGEMLLWILLKSSFWTLREAILGFVFGGVVGFGIGVLFERSRLAERAFMPYVVASQTVPILAIAPMVVVWGGQLAFPQWLSVAVIAAYLTFFPVAINTLRGLRSPNPTAVELMRSYAATPNEILWKLRVPAALPYIFTALKVSATASVIGAIIGELPAGFGDGLGRNLLNFSQAFAVQSPKLYGTVIVTSLVGIFFVGVISFAEHRIVGVTGRRVADAEGEAAG